MIVRWTPTALRDLKSLHGYAAATVELSLSGIDALARHPEMGRRGRVAGTRELIVAPYVVAYRITKGAIEIVAIIHAARRWPDSF
jgi:toxin ParE1/3/4